MSWIKELIQLSTDSVKEENGRRFSDLFPDTVHINHCNEHKGENSAGERKGKWE